LLATLNFFKKALSQVKLAGSTYLYG